MTSIFKIFKNTFLRSISDEESSDWNIAQNTHDNKEKIQALENYLWCHRGLCRFLWEGGGKLEQFLIDFGSKKEEKQYKDGDMVFNEGFAPYIYRSPGNGNVEGE